MERHILIVDDEPEFLYGLDLFLKKTGFTTTKAADGAEALCRIIRKTGKNFDLVLLDLDLPRIDGFGFLSALSAYGIEIPVIVISGTLDVQRYVDLVRAGCHDILLKPVNPELLRRRITEVFAAGTRDAVSPPSSAA